MNNDITTFTVHNIVAALNVDLKDGEWLQMEIKGHWLHCNWKVLGEQTVADTSNLVDKLKLSLCCDDQSDLVKKGSNK